jgi:guanylate kinase
MTEHAQTTPPREGRRGSLIVISSPSGAGKTTLSRRLLEEFPSIGFSVSLTTRPPREGEVDGVDYEFVDHATFDRMIAEQALAEWAEVHGNRYGTSRAAVESALAEGRDMLFDIDWQGGRALAGQWPDDVVKVFVLPPSLAVLEARLRGRGTDDAQVIERRLRRAVEEMAHYPEYDYLVVNDDLDQAYATLRAVYLTSRLTTRLTSRPTGRPMGQPMRRNGPDAGAGEELPGELTARAEASRVDVMAERARGIISGAGALSSPGR